MAGAHGALPVIGDLRRALTGASFAQGVCDRPLLADLCKARPERPPLDDARVAALKESTRALVAGAGGTTDVTVVHWQERHAGVVVAAVARYPDSRAAADALEAAGASTAGPGDAVAGYPVVRTAWLAGRHLLVGILASASDESSAADQLVRSRRQVAGSVGLARAVWFEAVALGPLLLLFFALVTVRPAHGHRLGGGNARFA